MNDPDNRPARPLASLLPTVLPGYPIDLKRRGAHIPTYRSRYEAEFAAKRFKRDERGYPIIEAYFLPGEHP